MMILVFGVWLRWLPVAGYVPLDAGLWPNLGSLLMPSVWLGLVQSTLIARITRSSMLDVLREQFILAGRAKGLDERVVVRLPLRWRCGYGRAWSSFVTVFWISSSEASAPVTSRSSPVARKASLPVDRWVMSIISAPSL